MFNIIRLFGLVMERNDIQQKLASELQQLVGPDSQSTPLTRDLLSKMNYLQCVLKESSRLLNTNSIIPPHRTTADDNDVRGYYVPKGVRIYLFIFIHAWICFHRYTHPYLSDLIFDIYRR